MKLIPLIGFKGIFGHWQREEKKGLNREIRVCVLERVCGCVWAMGRMIVHPIMSQQGGFDHIEQEALSRTSFLRRNLKRIMLTINYFNLVHFYADDTLISSMQSPLTHVIVLQFVH